MQTYVDKCAFLAIISSALGVIVTNKPIKAGIAIVDPLETRNRYERSKHDSLTGMKFSEFKN